MSRRSTLALIASAASLAACHCPTASGAVPDAHDAADPAGAIATYDDRVTPDGGPAMAGQDVPDSDVEPADEFALTLGQPAAAERPARPPVLLSAGGEYQFDTHLDTAGDFNVARALAGIGTRFPLGDRFRIGVSAAYDFAGYDFDDAAVFGGGTPWGDINTWRLMVVGNYAIDEHWSIVAGGVVAVAYESGADVSGSWTGGGFIGGGYRVSDALNIQLGVSVTGRIEDDPQVLPMFVANWAIDDHWKLAAGALEFGVADVVGVGVTYRVDDHWSLGARVGYVDQRFRLDDSGFAPDGVGEDQRGKAALVLGWRPSPGLRLSVLGGVAFGGELRVEDQNGRRLFNEEYDPAPFVAARVLWAF